MKWEYLTVLCHAGRGLFGGKFKEQALTDNLNELGQENWELVSMTTTNTELFGATRDIVLILKRPVPSGEIPQSVPSDVRRSEVL